MKAEKVITVVEFHSNGETFKVVIGGLPNQENQCEMRGNFSSCSF
jgi:proline racemase